MDSSVAGVKRECTLVAQQVRYKKYGIATELRYKELRHSPSNYSVRLHVASSPPHLWSQPCTGGELPTMALARAPA